jgi:hypothetical protein
MSDFQIPPHEPPPFGFNKNEEEQQAARSIFDQNQKKINTSELSRRVKSSTPVRTKRAIPALKESKDKEEEEKFIQAHFIQEVVKKAKPKLEMSATGLLGFILDEPIESWLPELIHTLQDKELPTVPKDIAERVWNFLVLCAQNNGKQIDAHNLQELAEQGNYTELLSYMPDSSVIVEFLINGSNG